MPTAEVFDVIVVGGGPAGSVMAWSLARRGVRVAVLERAVFPREKVCGDFVEPAGLRILQAMGGLEAIDAPVPITTTRVFVGPRQVYQGAIPFYENSQGLPTHGHIVPRHVLDTHLLERAAAAGARVFEGCEASDVAQVDGRMRVAAVSGAKAFELTAPLVVGADGAESIVARRFGQRRADRRYIALSQRAYVEGVEGAGGEATIWFDDDIFPGYGWMFPMAGGRANVGVGMLSETCHRHGLSVPKAFAACVQKLRIRHPACAGIRVASRPLGGVVKTYGGAGSNHFDGGLLVGDAGSFADPLTGEGITQGMESALIAAPTLLAALESGRFDAAFLASYERDFRTHFDPAMRFLDLWAAVTRNWRLREFWLRATARGFDEAARDPDFGRVTGAAFGGLDLRPLAVVEQVWSRVLAHVGQDGMAGLADLLAGRPPTALAGDFRAWREGWSRSVAEDPGWHFAWMGDVALKWARVQPSLWATRQSPRMAGPSALAAAFE
ncbi:MAG TPA: NAD(P)/FAD-dependent oxidoreductase [Caulobacteraceae bacterium]